ncbi:MAG: hypothetical protein GQ578_02160 [Desulfuromonadaceae bacterium]|nr:hypothetical protein [Desulfuromonadaceae bacterium]
MKSNRITPWMAKADRAIVFVTSILLLLIATPAWSAVGKRPLTDTDCVKCHRQPVEHINSRGGAHKTELGCFGCHVAHPPLGEALIPECSECHARDETPHFMLPECNRCHNPHAPVVVDFSALGETKPACLSCHEEVGESMAQLPSQHADQDCSECHNQHGVEEGQFMTCLECHEGHSEQMVYQDCLSCHDPHQPTVYAWNQDTPVSLCGACHAEEVENLRTQGGAHAEAIHCSECHQRHPPAAEGVIPACADCHDPGDSPHFKFDNCAACHNPHAPLEIDLSVSPVKPVCLSCHTAPVRQMERHPSAHAEMDCNECHQQHGDFQECLECHSGHSTEMNYADCLRCHSPHAPDRLQFSSSGVKSELCGSCHHDQFAQLVDNRSLHAELECIFCHKRTHKAILTCDNCHGQPHDSSMHQQFEDCSKCHKGPHNLRN